MKKVLAICAALAAVLLSACDKTGGLDNDFWEDAPLNMKQHQYQIETFVLADFYGQWNNAYASFVEEWPESYKGVKDPALVFSNRRWYPADFGPYFWRDFDLDDKLYPGTDPVSYYDCDSHPYVKTDLGDGSYKIEVDFLGFQWSGILTPGQDCVLTTEYSDEFRLRLLPAGASYDHSLDDLLQVARKCGRKRK